MNWSRARSVAVLFAVAALLCWLIGVFTNGKGPGAGMVGMLGYAIVAVGVGLGLVILALRS